MNNDKEYLEQLRHSCAHLLAAAVMELWPSAQRTIGPAIDDGFYFDFDFGEQKVSEDDFSRIEKKMHEMVKTWEGFERHELSVEDAKKEYPKNPYKQELIDEFAQTAEKLSFYKSGAYWDLCRGGHCEQPARELQYFKLLSIAGAYWRGDVKNPMLTRIYGACFVSKKELDEYLHRMEEAKKRDHKKLGKDLDLFVFSETVGKGLPMLTPRGATIRRELERFIVDEELQRGYLHVYTPDIANLKLYEKSGHYPYYKESMYEPINIDDEQYMLRPMTCPHHFELYLSRPRSYKELPMRIAELAQLYRYEQSGELMGLLRVRTFSLADAHIVCRRSQAEAEIHSVLDLIDYVAGVFGLQLGTDYSFRLSLGNRSDESKYYKDDAAWDEAETLLRTVLQARRAPVVEAPDEAAFYGPKIDIQMRNVNGKEDTAFTVQYDFVMPKRFHLTYTNEQGADEQPIVIHRSSIGCIERVLAFLIEHFAGAFPVWLSPVQVQIISVGTTHAEACAQLARNWRAAGLRVAVDDADETVGKKIRNATQMKIPYVLVIGDTEMNSDLLAVRLRGEKETISLSKDDFLNRVTERIATRSNEL